MITPLVQIGQLTCSWQFSNIYTFISFGHNFDTIVITTQALGIGVMPTQRHAFPKSATQHNLLAYYKYIMNQGYVY